MQCARDSGHFRAQGDQTRVVYCDTDDDYNGVDDDGVDVGSCNMGSPSDADCPSHVESVGAASETVMECTLERYEEEANVQLAVCSRCY